MSDSNVMNILDLETRNMHDSVVQTWMWYLPIGRCLYIV